MLEKSLETAENAEKTLDSVSSTEAKLTSVDEYVLFQKRIFMATVAVSAFTVVIAATLFGLQNALSIMFGAISGLLYFRLLARSIGKLGTESKTVSKTQLLVPVLLVLVAARQPQIELLPAMLGFLLYKPSLILNGLLESRTWGTPDL